MLNKDRDSINKYINTKREQVTKRIKKLQLVVKNLKKAVFAANANSKYLDIFFFTNSSQALPYKREQYTQNYNYSIEDAIERFINKINIELNV